MNSDLDDALRDAVATGDIPALSALLAQLDEIKGKYPNNTKTPLIIAAELRVVDAARLLLESGAPVDGKNQWGETALTVAADAGHTEVAALLLEWGADVNVIDDNSNSPLYLAADNEYEDTLRLLLKHGADPNIVNVNGNLTPMWIAIAFNRVNIVTILLEGGVDPNKLDQYGKPLFMEALSDEDMTRVMLAHGADVNWRDDQGKSVLTWAHIDCCHETIPLLEASGATL